MKQKKASILYCIVSFMLFTQYLSYPQKTYDNSSIFNSIEDSYNKLVKKCNMPVIKINFDNTKVDSLHQEVVIDSKKEVANSKYYLGVSAGILAHKDTLIILDSKGNSILLSDYNGKIIKTVGRFGSGPGEFKNPALIAENKNYYFVYDHSNARIQLLNKKYKYIKSFPIMFLPAQVNISANEKNILLNANHTIPYNITSYSLEKLSFKKSNAIDEKFAFEKDLKNNNIFYGMLLDASSDRYITAVSSMLPYIFVFDKNGKPLYSIKYEGQVVKDVARFETNNKNSQQALFRVLATDAHVVGHNLFVLMRNRVYVFDLKSKTLKKVYGVRKKTADKFAIYGDTIFTCLFADVYKAKIKY